MTAIAIPRVLSRPNLFMGGERTLVLLSIAWCGGIGVPSGSLLTMGVCLLVWLVALWGLRAMAEVDPYLSKVYLRSLRYRPFYPARSRPGACR